MKMRKIAAIAAAVALVGSGMMFAAPAFADDTAPPPEEAVTQVDEAAATPAEEVATEEPVAEPAVEEGPAEEAPATEEAKPAAPAAPAPAAKTVTPQTQPDFICDEDGEGWQAKVDWDGDGNPTVTAPSGFLIDAYCVKSSTAKHIVEVDPAASSVEIDHPDKDSVSHYQVHLIPVTVTVTNQCPGVIAGDTSTNVSNLWGNVDTRSAGHYEYVDGGLHVWTDDNSSQAKVSLGRALSFPLKNTGTLGLDWTGTTPPPGINLFVDFDNNGSVDGTLVYESVYGQDLWLTNGSAQFVKDNAPVVGGGNGSQWHGTIDQWLTKYPTAQVKGFAFALGSGVKGDGVINSITVGCSTFYFDYEETTVTPVLTWDAPTCDEPGSITSPEQEGVVWGAVLNEDGSTTYTASPAEGYKFPEGSQIEWTVPNLDQLGENDPLCVVDYPVPALFNAPTAEPTCAVGAQFNEGFLGEPVDSGEGWATYEFENIFVQVDRSVDGEVTFYIWPKDGYELTNLDGWTEDSDEQGTYWYRTIVLEGPLGYQTTDPTAECYQVPQPAAPTWFENCGTDNDTWVVPGNTDQFFYEVTEEGSTVTITANLRSENLEWAEGVTTEWSHTFTDEDCPVDTPPTTPGKAPLAATGGGAMSPLIPTAGGLLVMLGLALGAIHIVRRRMMV